MNFCKRIPTCFSVKIMFMLSKGYLMVNNKRAKHMLTLNNAIFETLKKEMLLRK